VPRKRGAGGGKPYGGVVKWRGEGEEGESLPNRNTRTKSQAERFAKDAKKRGESGKMTHDGWDAAGRTSIGGLLPRRGTKANSKDQKTKLDPPVARHPSRIDTRVNTFPGREAQAGGKKILKKLTKIPTTSCKRRISSDKPGKKRPQGWKVGGNRWRVPHGTGGHMKKGVRETSTRSKIRLKVEGPRNEKTQNFEMPEKPIRERAGSLVGQR